MSRSSIIRRAKRARERTRKVILEPGAGEWHRSENYQQPVLPFNQEVENETRPPFEEPFAIQEAETSNEFQKNHATPPPRLGERLLLLILTKEDRINVPGDLEEEFAHIAVKHGDRFAKVWYYKQVAASAWPMSLKAIRWGIFAWMSEWIRRHIS